MGGVRRVEERIRRFLAYARDAEARGEREVAKNFLAMARDLEPAPAPRVARSI